MTAETPVLSDPLAWARTQYARSLFPDHDVLHYVHDRESRTGDGRAGTHTYWPVARVSRSAAGVSPTPDFDTLRLDLIRPGPALHHPTASHRARPGSANTPKGLGRGTEGYLGLDADCARRASGQSAEHACRATMAKQAGGSGRGPGPELPHLWRTGQVRPLRQTQ